MPLVTSEAMLRAAQKGRYAVGAFNVENMETAQAVVAAATELNAPVIIQTTPATLRFGAPEVFVGIVSALAARAPVPVALHLDHGDSFETAMRALREGYTSLMIDGSALPVEQNVELACRVVAAAKPNNIPVEAELGRVGGKEDDVVGGDGGYTDPADAAEFVARTGVSSLAVAIGTAHGVYKTVPRLDVGRLAEIRAAVDVPLVLHGASGLSAEAIRSCIEKGICKINFATDLRIAYSDGIKTCLAQEPGVIDPKKYGAAGRAEVMAVVRHRIGVCGSRNRA